MRRSSGENHVKLFLGVARLHLKMHRLFDEGLQKLERLRLLLEQHVDDGLARLNVKLLRLLILLAEPHDLTHDRVADGACRADLSPAAAHGTRFAEDVCKRLAGALSRHLDEAELGEVAHRHAGAVG